MYELDRAAFEEWPPAEGQWIARHSVEPLAVRPMGDLLDRHVQAGIELRFVPELSTFWREVVASGLAFSGVRLAALTSGSARAVLVAKLAHAR